MAKRRLFGASEETICIACPSISLPLCPAVKPGGDHGTRRGIGPSSRLKLRVSIWLYAFFLSIEGRGEHAECRGTMSFFVVPVAAGSAASQSQIGRINY